VPLLRRHSHQEGMGPDPHFWVWDMGGLFGYMTHMAYGQKISAGFQTWIHPLKCHSSSFSSLLGDHCGK